MKFFSIISIFLTLLFSTILILGIISGSDTFLEAEITIEAPDAVILRTLLDFNNYPQWCPAVKETSYSTDSGTRQVVYQIADKRIIVHENISVNSAKNTIVFSQQDLVQQSYLQGMRNQIKLTTLQDGSTEVYWNLQYSVKPVFAKLLNKLFIEPDFNKMLQNNVTALKSYIER